MKSTIRTKLLGSFGIILLMLIALTFYMLYVFNDTSKNYTAQVESSSKKVELSYELMRGLLNISRQEKNLIIANDSLQQENFWERVSELINKIEDERKTLEGLVDGRGIIILSDFGGFWEDYKQELQKLKGLSIFNLDNEAFQLTGEIEAFRSGAIGKLEQLIEKNRQDIQLQKLENDKRFNSAITSVFIIIIISIILAILISFAIVKSINKRISTIAQKAERIASREQVPGLLEHSIDDEMNPIVLSLISINESFKEVAENANRVASGEFALKIEPRSDKDILGIAIKKMAFSLQSTTAANQKHNWLATGLNVLNDKLMGNQDIEELAENIISFLSHYLNASIGAIYLMTEQGKELRLTGQYAFSSPGKIKKKFALNEGLIGQAARNKKPIILNDLSQDNLKITSSVVNTIPNNLIITPFLFEKKVLGVFELGKLGEFDEKEKEFLELSAENIALAVHSAIARRKIQELLNETQIQSEELQSQQEELKQMNEELEEQTQNLKQQQEELQMTNVELEEQTQSLETKNKEIEAAKYDIEQKTKQLEISSKYKSEFLANMSHELRTPLNSLLILSKDLCENKNQNLDEVQVESAEIIYKSGRDLLVLINEVLDLSRVESGKMNIHVERVNVRDLINNLVKSFKHEAAQKNLELKCNFENDVPETITTDAQRLNQILKNLLSNALKFTEHGSISLILASKEDHSIAISVKDTGIGIKKEKQMAVFEAFQQADGGTARKYGGTGLGLSISRELAKLLGGEITLESKINEGSVFTLSLPVLLKISQDEEPAREKVLPSSKTTYPQQNYFDYPSIEDDRDAITPEDKIVLIIEDDLEFAKILKRQANQKAFKALTASTGEDGLLLAEKYRPHAIILDIELPGMNGRQVLADIKSNPEIRHIPVHIVSVDERSLEPIREGAVEYLTKPIDKNDLEKAFNRIEDFVERKMKNLLIIEDDANSRTAIRKLIGNGDVHCLEAGSGKEAMEKFKNNNIDCIVLDIGLPDMSGFDFIQQLENKNENIPPIIIYTGKELNREENEELEKYTDSIIIKGVKSEERLLDETALFLHRTIKNLPEKKQKVIAGLYDKNSIFQGKKVLVVDDDMRNVFALTKILKEKGIEVFKAENGKRALRILEETEDIDLVLMDIMMPEMDGYEAMQKIRKQPRFRDLPILALTAKAMRDDKQKCIDAGANDYIAKPVDIPRLLSLMQVWLSK